MLCLRAYQTELPHLTKFTEHTQVDPSNSISISSAIFAQLVHVPSTRRPYNAPHMWQRSTSTHCMQVMRSNNLQAVCVSLPQVQPSGQACWSDRRNPAERRTLTFRTWSVSTQSHVHTRHSYHQDFRHGHHQHRSRVAGEGHCVAPPRWPRQIALLHISPSVL